MSHAFKIVLAFCKRLVVAYGMVSVDTLHHLFNFYLMEGKQEDFHWVRKREKPMYHLALYTFQGFHAQVSMTGSGQNLFDIPCVHTWRDTTYYIHFNIEYLVACCTLSSSSGRRTRTSDFQVMSLTSYLCSTPHQVSKNKICLNCGLGPLCSGLT